MMIGVPPACEAWSTSMHFPDVRLTIGTLFVGAGRGGSHFWGALPLQGSRKKLSPLAIPVPPTSMHFPAPPFSSPAVVNVHCWLRPPWHAQMIIWSLSLPCPPAASRHIE